MVIIKEVNCSILSRNSVAGPHVAHGITESSTEFYIFFPSQCLTNLRRHSGAAEV